MATKKSEPHQWEYLSSSSGRDGVLLTRSELTRCSRCDALRRISQTRYDVPREVWATSTLYSNDQSLWSAKAPTCSPRTALASVPT